MPPRGGPTLGGMKSRLCFALALTAGLSLASSVARADEAAPSSGVLVHISSKVPAKLERRDVGTTWVVVCDAPCDREVPPGDEYRMVDGRKGQAGAPFRLKPNPEGALELKFEPASAAGEVGGTALVVVGSGLAIASFVGLVAGIGLASQPTTPCGNDWCGLGAAVGQFIAIVSGVGLVAGGGVILGGVAVMDDAKAKTTQRAWAGREPTWLGPQLGAPPKRAALVPLSFSF